MLALVQVAAVAYLIGSIPFSFLVARAFGVEDVRRVGSGNVGATNVLRSAGKAAGALALLLDLGKGAAATALAFSARGPDPVALAAAFTAALVAFRHRSNLRRILGGTERRVGQPKE